MSSSVKVAVVLGPGRSCTSGVAKGLHLAGFPMGNMLVKPDHGNQEGYYEDWPLVWVNDSMIKDAGGVWRDPSFVQTCKVPITDLNIRKCAEYVTMRIEDHNGNWGMKDPRLVLTWNVWKHTFETLFPEIDIIEVYVKREPERIAASCHRLDKLIEPAAWEVLAREYHRRMHAHLSV